MSKLGDLDLGLIHNMNNIEGLSKIPDKSIDLIVADPPYCIAKKWESPNQNFQNMKDRKNKRVGTDFGEWDTNIEHEPWMKESFRVLKDGGSLVVFFALNHQNIYSVATGVGFNYKDTLIWHKTNPMPRNRDRRYVPNVEVHQWYIKPGKWTFNRQDEKYEGCISSFASESGGGFKRYHPTQKPVKLIEKVIRIHSNENAIILDPFMGSGTTAIAILKVGGDRQFIGFEISEEYASIANQRVHEYLNIN